MTSVQKQHHEGLSRPREASPAPPPAHGSAPSVSRAQQRVGAGMRQVPGTGLRRMDRLPAPSYSLRLFLFSFFSLFFPPELLLPFSFLPGPLLISVRDKITLERCGFLQASHTTYDFQTENPLGDSGMLQEEPPPRGPHGEGGLFSAHRLRELLEERGTTSPACSPECSALPATWRERSPQRREEEPDRRRFPAPPAPLTGLGAAPVQWCSPVSVQSPVLRAVTGEREGNQTWDLMPTKGWRRSGEDG